MIILKPEILNLIKNNSIPTSFQDTSQHRTSSLPNEEKTSFRASQRRLRIENRNHIGQSNDELIDLLIKYGNNSEGLPPVLYASKTGDFAAVKLLLKHGADINTRDGSEHKWGALHYALLSENYSLIKFLLESGLNPNESSKSAFHIPVWSEATKSCSTETFRLLIEYGVRLDVEYYIRPESMNPYIYHCPTLQCIINGNLECLKLIVESGGEIPITHHLHMNTNLAMGSITQAPILGQTGNTRVEILKWLLINKYVFFKDIEEKSNEYIYHHDILSFMIGYKLIDINAPVKNMNYITYPIHLVGCYPKSLQVLIDNGANVNAGNGKEGGYGRTALHNIVSTTPYNKVLESIKILISNNADINALDSLGRTPLFYAQHPTIKQLLIENGGILKGN